jgi:hypothetical protein
MTEASYEKNRRQGVTGRKVDTCWPAAFDMISLRGKVSAETYIECAELAAIYQKKYLHRTEPPEVAKRYEDYVKILYSELHTSYGSLMYDTANSKAALEKKLNARLDKKQRVVVQLKLRGMLHAAGIMKGPEPGLYIVKCTWTPWPSDIVTAGDIWKYMLRQKENIHALPPG